jgi:hypothetical protein
MTHEDTDSAAARLSEIAAYFREHPVTGPLEGHATTVTAAAPMRIDTLDYLTATVREVADHTRTANPDAGPLPERLQDVYTWMREHTEHAPEDVQVRADAIEYRQWLEHCLEAGDHETVRRQVRQQPCPKCGCWGLMWMPEQREAYCTNTECTDRDGFSTHLSLARLAHAHATANRKVRQARAT